MNLVKYTRIFLRGCDRMFKTKNIGTSLDRIRMRFSESILTATLSMFMYATLYTMNSAVMFLNGEVLL